METMHAAGRRRLPPVPRAAAERKGAGPRTTERPHARVAAGAAAVRTAPEVEDAAPVARDTELIDTRQIAAELIDAELAALPDPAPAAADETAADDTTAVDIELDETARFVVPEITDDVPAEPQEEPAEAVVPDVSAETETEAEAEADAALDEQDPAQQFVARLRSLGTDFAGAAGADSAVVREAVPPARHRRARCRLVLRYEDGHVADVTFLGPAGAPGGPSRHGFDRHILRWLSADPSPDGAWLVDDADAPDGVAVDLSAWVAAD